MTAPNKKHYRDVNNVNAENYLRELSVQMTNFENELKQVTSSNLDTTFRAFIKLFAEVINTHVPLKPSSRKQNRFQNKPWLTKGLFVL